MFRLTEYMHQLVNPTAVRARRGTGPVKPVVIWNLTRRCNLRSRTWSAKRKCSRAV